MKSLGYCSGVKQTDGEHCFMILCEVALGKTKEIGLPNDEDGDDDDHTKQLDLSKYQSRKGVGRDIPDPRYTITRNSGMTILKKSFSYWFFHFLRCSYAIRKIDFKFSFKSLWWFEF